MNRAKATIQSQGLEPLGSALEQPATLTPAAAAPRPNTVHPSESLVTQTPSITSVVKVSAFSNVVIPPAKRMKAADSTAGAGAHSAARSSQTLTGVVRAGRKVPGMASLRPVPLFAEANRIAKPAVGSPSKPQVTSQPLVIPPSQPVVNVSQPRENERPFDDQGATPLPFNIKRESRRRR